MANGIDWVELELRGMNGDLTPTESKAVLAMARKLSEQNRNISFCLMCGLGLTNASGQMGFNHAADCPVRVLQLDRKDTN